VEKYKTANVQADTQPGAHHEVLRKGYLRHVEICPTRIVDDRTAFPGRLLLAIHERFSGCWLMIV